MMLALFNQAAAMPQLDGPERPRQSHQGIFVLLKFLLLDLI